MVRSYKYAIVKCAPNDGRDEQLNVAALVFNPDGVDIHIGHRLEKLKAISGAIDPDLVRRLIERIPSVDRRSLSMDIKDISERAQALSRLGPITLSPLGTFTITSENEYAERLSAIIQSMVDPEPAPQKIRVKRSSLLSQLKSEFRKERVLASKDDNIDSHRILSSYEIDRGLVADLAFKNGVMHIIQTVDASNDENAIRKTISDIGVSALILERARMTFGEEQTKGRLVYTASAALENVAKPALDAAEHQGAELINWDSGSDRSKFIHALSILATPLEEPKKNKKRRFIDDTGSLLH